MKVVIDQVSKRFGQTDVLHQVSLLVEDHELFFLLGPSGCGKTTLLRLLAGFYEPDAGQIRFGNKVMNPVPPHQRNTGMVFQNYALWPHLSVAGNVAYGLEVRHVTPREKQERVRAALDMTRMEAYADRFPNQLSGGQQQRVALARALVVQPEVLLLDEPLSNLDAKLRLEMREEIRRIHAHTRITTIYVTHDQKESLSLADRMAVMQAGKIEQVGDPRTVYRQPANRFVADFMGETNWLEALVELSSPEALVLRSDTLRLHALPRIGFQPGQPVRVGIRPEAVQIGPAERNAFSTVIAQVTYLGEIEQYLLQLSPSVVLKAFEQNPQELRLAGAVLPVHVAPHCVMVFPPEG